jgi:hypothetical protein
MKIKVEFEIDAREIAKKIGRRVTAMELEEKVCEMVDDEVIQNVTYNGLEDWDAYEKVMRDVEEYLNDWYEEEERDESDFM